MDSVALCNNSQLEDLCELGWGSKMIVHGECLSWESNGDVNLGDHSVTVYICPWGSRHRCS